MAAAARKAKGTGPVAGAAGARAELELELELEQRHAVADLKLVRRREGRLFAVTGASRSGKSLWTAQQVAGARRLLVWDLLGEWSARYRCERVSSIADLVARLEGPPARLAFHRPRMVDQFGLFCRVAWCWLRLAPGSLVVEETAAVTQPGKAPGEWGDICRMGLRYGVDIYALTQRPAESDKTAFGNASVIHAGRAVTPRDRATVAEYLDVPVAEVAALTPLEWIERHASGEKKTGKVSTTART